VPTRPVVVGLVGLSAIPAVLLAGYVWYADGTRGHEPPAALLATALLGLLFAGFAGVVTPVLGRPLLVGLAEAGLPTAAGIPVIMFLVVAPVEEVVKLLAVRLGPYRRPGFDAVVDGAVYGAMAGLGFATIENVLYIGQVAPGMDAAVGRQSVVATLRAFAGPGHVVYSALAGYYLGLARFNRAHAVPLVLKGLLIAVSLHGLYNALARVVPDYLAAWTGATEFAAVLAFLVVFQGTVTALLVRKLARYNAAVRASAPAEVDPPSEPTEFDP
jgi:RsiW-degrading membrane proteinase PrsW (M82 family)